MQRKPRFKNETDTGIGLLWCLVIFSLAFNGCLLGVFISFGGAAGKDGENGTDGVNGIDGIASLEDIEITSLRVITLHAHNVISTDSLETYGTVDIN